MDVYHYTTAYRAKQIFEQKDLRPSMNTTIDCNYGQGRYVTDIDPKKSDAFLMFALYGQRLNSKYADQLLKHMEAYVHLIINKHSLKYCRDHVYLYEMHYTGDILYVGWGRR